MRPLSSRARARDRHGTRASPDPAGQSLVEFALILPVLLLIVLGAADLGRIYLSTINLENAAKEGAFFGARNPTCATDGGPACADPQNVEARVERELDVVTADAIAAACYPTGTTDFSGSGKDLDDCTDGDLYRVTVSATFRLVTPLIGAIVGSSIGLTSDATSVVLTSFTAGGDPIDPGDPSATPAPTNAPDECTVPSFLNGTRLGDAQDVWENAAGFTTTVNTVGPNGQAIAWQSLPPGTVGPCDSVVITVSDTVQSPPTPSPTPSPTPTPEPTPTPTGSPAPTPSPSATPTPTPTPPVCTVPQLVFGGRNALTVTQAQGAWVAAGFQAANFAAVRPPNNDYDVASQSIGAGASRPCLTTSITVDN